MQYGRDFRVDKVCFFDSISVVVDKGWKWEVGSGKYVAVLKPFLPDYQAWIELVEKLVY